eukprot:1160406-Pelagomonas_calceolata.AAC.9
MQARNARMLTLAPASPCNAPFRASLGPNERNGARVAAQIQPHCVQPILLPPQQSQISFQEIWVLLHQLRSIPAPDMVIC